jgi:hypothetical protein
MGVLGGLLILLGIATMGLSFGVGVPVAGLGAGAGFGVLVLGCVRVGLERIYRAIRTSSAAESKAL